MRGIDRAFATAQLARMRRWITNPWLIGGVGGAVLMYSLLGFLLVPYLARHFVPEWVATQLKRQASVGDIHFNPWLFTLEVRDFAMTEADRRPILAFGRLFVDFEPGSLLSGPWTVAELSLEQARVHVAKGPDGKLNLQRIADDMPPSQEPPKPASEPVQFRLERLALVDGEVHYQDPGAGIEETLRPLDLELDGLSTQADRIGSYSLSTRLTNGGELAIRGDLALTPVSAKGEISLQGLKLATPWRFLKDLLAMAEPGGDAHLAAKFRYADGQFTVADADFGIAKLQLASADGEMLTLERIGFAGAQFDLAAHSLKLPSFTIEQGRLAVARDAQGELNWQRLMKPTPPVPNAEPQTAAAPGAKPPQPWRIELDALKIADVAIHYADDTRRVPLDAAIGRFGLDLKAVAEFGGEQTQLQVQGLNASLADIALNDPGQAKPAIAVNGLTVEGGELDLAQRRLGLRSVALQGGGTSVERLADGSVPLAERFAPKSTPATSEQPAAAKPPEGGGWRIAVAKLGLNDFRLGYLDRGFTPELAYDANDIDIAIKDIANDGKTPVSFDIGLALQQGGKLNASGTAAQTGEQVQAKLKVDHLDLKPLQSVLARYAALKLVSGDLSTALDVQYLQLPAGPGVRVIGGLALDKLRTNETATGDRFLSWNKMKAEAIDFSLNPDHLFIKEVRFIEPGSKIAIKEDKTTNLVTVFSEKIDKLPASKPAQAAKPTPATPGRGAKADKRVSSGPFPVKIERVRLENGIMNFSDLSLVIPFSTTIHDFDGIVTDIATASDSHTRLDFAGRVEEYGTAKVDGVLIPQKILADSSIRVVFRNVSMGSLSPYSATFAGRKIESGKLNLDLDYRIQDGMLKSENKILLEQFALGDSVESPNATSLPLDLAIALLTDGEGKITASVPVEGDIRKPEFRYGKAVWDAFVTLITKAATAPFRALGSLIGAGGEEDVGVLVFEPGVDILPPPEREKTMKVADGMAQRPMIKLVVHGAYDADKDGEALRSLRVRRAVAKAMKRDLAPDEDPGLLSFSNAETQKALEDVARGRGGAALLDSLQKDFEKTAGRKPKRVGAVSALLGRASEDQAFYESLFRELVKTESLPADDLQALADRRADAIVKELAAQPGYDAGRVKKGAAETVGADKDGRIPLTLDVGT